ncbi:tyrosine-type recombinase/integrase [Paenisporosarcina sp. FSL H8-0542]|uniref:tyrosine-type recombinase/integrase n=1 Tax=Paenisporosarcina sp. FSL H8-0542 TaxID=2921401 RepID=UPI00315AE28D
MTMTINKSINISFEEICNQLGISESKLINFLNDNDTNIEKSSISNENTALFVLEKYQEHLKKMVSIGKRSEETATTYNNFILRIKKYILNNNPNLNVNELNEIVLNEIIINRNSERKFSIRTINKYNAIMKSILKFAFEMNYTNKDYRYKFTLEKTSLIPRYIKEEHIPKIFETIKELSKPHRCRGMIMFLLLTGCRVSEISNIKLRDFDIENDLITIYDGKGNKDRVIPMFYELKVEILLYLQKSGMSDWNRKCEGYLFARDEGIERKRKFPIRAYQHLVERIKKRMPELSEITAHSFRHTFAVSCLKIGIEQHHLTEILGHSDPKTTMTYTKLRGEDLRDAINNRFPYPFEILLKTINEDSNATNNNR